MGYSSYLRVSSFSFGINSRHFVFPVVNCCCDRMMHFLGISLLLSLKMKCWCLSLQFLGSFPLDPPLNRNEIVFFDKTCLAEIDPRCILSFSDTIV